MGQNDLVKWPWFLSQPAVTGSRSKKLFVFRQCRSLLWSGSRNSKVSCAYLRDKNNLLWKHVCEFQAARASELFLGYPVAVRGPGLNTMPQAYLSSQGQKSTICARRPYSSTLPFPNTKLLPVCPVSSLMSLMGVKQLLGAGC